jgi:hypothetical protein
VLRVIKPKKMQLLLFELIPAGIIMLILSVKSVRKSFSSDKILEIPCITKSDESRIDKPGIYSIWHQGQYFRRAPLDEFRPVVTNMDNGEKLKLTTSLFRPNKNNGIIARMELFRFKAPAGLLFNNSFRIIDNWRIGWRHTLRPDISPLI